MFKKLVIAVSASVLLTACAGYVPQEWRPESAEERGLRWAVKLCHQIGYTEIGSEARRKCIADRYDQWLASR